MEYKSPKINLVNTGTSSDNLVYGPPAPTDSVYETYYLPEETEEPTEVPIVDPTSAYKFIEHDSNKNGIVTDLVNTNHRYTEGKNNMVRGDYDIGRISYDSNNSFIYVDPRQYGIDGCHEMAGACETEDYIIVSYKTQDDRKGMIAFYDKKTKQKIGEFYSDQLGHSNGLATDGERVYVATGNPLDDKNVIEMEKGSLSGDQNGKSFMSNRQVASFSIDEALAVMKNRPEYEPSDSFFENLSNKVSYLSDVYNSGPEITIEDLKIGTGNTVGLYSLTAISHYSGNENNNGVTAFSCGDYVYVVKGDEVTGFQKINRNNSFSQRKRDLLNENSNDNIAFFNSFLWSSISNRGDCVYPDQNQDICVTDDYVYVIRGKLPTPKTEFTPPPDGDERNLYMSGDAYDDPSEYNVIDIYDLDGNYKGTKKVDIPQKAGENGQCYRELESMSYDSTTDSFTLYFSNSFYKASNDHIIVDGVKIDVPEENAPNPLSR